MQGHQEVIDQLKKILTNELTTINQYFLHARMFDNWGLKKLGEHEYKESIDEMKHADELIERILFLEGMPNLQQLNRLLIGENVPEALRADLQQEQTAMPVIREGIGICEQQNDYVSRNLLREILEGEEEHVNWLETQLDLIEKMGLENYIQSQAS
jgi:bacterioferritin